MIDDEFEEWWRSINDDWCISGRLAGNEDGPRLWLELWPEAREELRKICDAAIKADKDQFTHEDNQN